MEHTNQAYASLFTIFVAHANRTGFEDGLNFWGGSTVFDPNGKLVHQAPYFEEAILKTEIDLNQLHRTRSRLPLLRDERPELLQVGEVVAQGMGGDALLVPQVARKISDGRIKSPTHGIPEKGRMTKGE